MQKIGVHSNNNSSDDDDDDTNINLKGLQRTANEYAEERRIYKDLISIALQYSACRI